MKKIVVLFAVLLLAGCSTKFAYKNLDWLVYWYVDDFVEFNKEQEQQFDIYIKEWQSWHKQYELPQYQAHLEELVSDISTQNISIERMEYHQDKARTHWYRLREHLAPGLADMATMLSDEQIEEFFDNLEKENVEEEEERQERLERSEKRRKNDWIDRNLDNLEDWLGRLSKEQEGFVENSYGSFQSTSQYWIEYRRNYQQALKEAFLMDNREEAFKQEMIRLITNPEAYRSEEMLKVSAENEKASKAYLLTLFSLSTEKQRQHLIEEINDLRDDVVELSK